MQQSNVILNPLDLTGKRILVTGASSGIGKGIALLLSRMGARLIITARDEQRLNETFEVLSGSGHIQYIADIANIDEIKALFAETISFDDKLTGLVHAAGIGPAIPLSVLDLKDLHKIFDINYFSFVELVKHYSKNRYAGAGSIVAISSVAGHVGWNGITAYSGSKGALEATIRAMAIELATKRIRVNAVAPSNIRTPMLNKTLEVLAGDPSLLNNKHPLGIGDIEDVANATLFLLSDASRFITGTSLVVDGGYIAQ